MSETLSSAAQWIVFLVFMLYVVGCTFAEAAWISRKNWSSFGKGFAFSTVSNIIGLGVGVFIGLGSLMLIVMVVFEPPKSSSFLYVLLIGAIIFGVVGAPVWLMLCKRMLLGFMKIQTGKSAWLYALVATLVIYAGSFIISAAASQLIALTLRTSA